MTPARFSLDELNAAINTAARGMTSATPSPELQARVMAKIDAAQPRWGWRLAVAGGAIAGVAILVATLRVSPKPDAPAMVAVASPMTTGPVSPKPTPEALAKADPTAAPIASSPLLSTVSVQRAATRTTVFSPSAAELEWRARAVQALEQPAALIVEPLDQPRLSIDPIDITPITIAPLNTGGAGASYK